jgi:hypothetical protein
MISFQCFSALGRIRAFALVGLLSASILAGNDGVAQSPPVRALRETMRIDGNAELLTSVSAVLVSASGNVILPSTRDHQLHIFDRSGKRLSSFGRKGDGPGEFQFPIGLFGLKGDSVWIYDQGSLRLTLMAPDGKLIRTQPTSYFTGELGLRQAKDDRLSLYASPYGFTSTGLLVAADQFPTQRDSLTMENALSITRPGGVVQQRLLAFEAEQFSVTGTVGSTRVNATRAFRRVRTLRASPKGGYYALAQGNEVARDKVEISVDLVNDRGSKVFSTKVPVRAVSLPKSVSDTAVERSLSRFTVSGGRGNAPPVSRAAARSALESRVRETVPSNFPPLAGVSISDQGVVWIKVVTGVEMYQWWSLNLKGEVSAAVSVPRNGSISYAKGDTLWVTERDEDDVPSVVRYVVEGRGR